MRRTSGFTLIEVLLSAAIVGVVAMIVHTLYRTVLVVREAQAGPSARAESLAGVMAAVGRDLAGAMRVEDESLPLELRESDGGFSILRLPALPTPPPGDERIGAIPLSVEYRVDTLDGNRLLRITRPLSGPGMQGAFATNEVLRGVAIFRVEAISGEEWKKEWKAGNDSAWPVACRVRIAEREIPDRVQDVVFEVPAALSVSSSIERR